MDYYDELKSICSKILFELRKIKSNSFICWVGGTARDYLRDQEPYDYDLLVYGTGFDKIVEIVSSVLHVENVNKKCPVIRGKARSGKKVDIYLATRKYFKDGVWNHDELYYNFLLDKENEGKEIVRDLMEWEAFRFSNEGIFIYYPGTEVISKEKWLEDFKNKKTSHLKKVSDYYLGDYIKAIKHASSGYKLYNKTRRKFIENSKIGYLCWRDKFVEKDLISFYQQIMILRIQRIYNFKSKYDFSTFFNLCLESGVFNFIFGCQPNKNKEWKLESKEDFLLEVYGQSLEKLDKNIGENYHIKNSFNF